MEYALKVNDADLAVLGKYLGGGIYAEVAPLVASIDTQVRAQQQAEHDKAADRKDEPSGAPA